MKFERHHEILKRLSKFGSVKVSDLSNSLNVTKETIRSDLNELARLGYLTRCHGGAFIVLDSLDTIADVLFKAFQTTERCYRHRYFWLR